MKKLFVFLLVSLIGGMSMGLYPVTEEAGDYVTGYKISRVSTSTDRFSRAQARFSSARSSDTLTSGRYQGFGVEVIAGNAERIFVGAVRGNNGLGMTGSTWKLCVRPSPGPGNQCASAGTHSYYVPAAGTPYALMANVAQTGGVRIQVQKETNGDWSLWWNDSGTSGNKKLGTLPNANWSEPTGLNGTASASIEVRYVAFARDLSDLHTIDVGNSTGSFLISDMKYALNSAPTSLVLAGSQTASGFIDSKMTETFYETGQWLYDYGTCVNDKPCGLVGGSGS